MVIGLLIINISLPYVETIKQTRNRVRSIKDTVRSKFNVSVSEIQDGGEGRNQSRIVVCAVSNDANYLNGTLSNVFNLIERNNADVISSYTTDFIQYEDSKPY
jgi:uncharacterized protein YlxP (DUF503 family)